MSHEKTDAFWNLSEQRDRLIAQCEKSIAYCEYSIREGNYEERFPQKSDPEFNKSPSNAEWMRARDKEVLAEMQDNIMRIRRGDCTSTIGDYRPKGFNDGKS